ncbi:MAG: hypothetical protein KatS3mg076_1913 [Candidatus Binatia bacterium]|nr:MAG: hypothetical protein KatS3mg076_1913 [Candidatus Binatia bacterium]
MRKVTLDDVVGLGRYERIRDEFRRRIIELKRRRRVAVGDRITFVFENFDTVLFQIQEMLRAESITDIDRIREEIEIYNSLIPEPGELSSTMLIEITEYEKIRPELLRLQGIDRAVAIELGEGLRVPGVFEAGRSKEDKLSAVQYVRFPFDPKAREAFADPGVPAAIVISHPNYQARAPIEGPVRESLLEDLAER